MINIIAAIGENRELGKDNKLLWHIPEDMKYFRDKTKGHPVIMGRKTHESIGRPLPERTNIVVTRRSNPELLKLDAPGLIVKHTIDESNAFAESIGTGEVFIIGGAQIYKQTLFKVDKLYLTIVHHSFDADSYFPEYKGEFEEIESKDSTDDNYAYTFKTFARIKALK